MSIALEADAAYLCKLVEELGIEDGGALTQHGRYTADTASALRVAVESVRADLRLLAEEGTP